MSIRPEDVPSDPARLVAMVLALDAENESLRAIVIQRKVTNGYRAMWAAEGEAAVRTVVDTARLTSGTTVFGTVLKTVSA